MIDTESPINHFATALSPYPQDAFGKFPVDGIRGNVILGKYSANFYVDPFMERFQILYYGVHLFTFTLSTLLLLKLISLQFSWLKSALITISLVEIFAVIMLLIENYVGCSKHKNLFWLNFN